jgi:hypothetical protein
MAAEVSGFLNLYCLYLNLSPYLPIPTPPPKA